MLISLDPRTILEQCIFLIEDPVSGVVATGFLITTDGWCLTARHNVLHPRTKQPHTKIPVYLYNPVTKRYDRRLDATVYAQPPLANLDLDVAFLKLDGNNFPAVKLSTDWQSEDALAIMGFQENPPVVIRGMVPAFHATAEQLMQSASIRGATTQELALRIKYVDSSWRIDRGTSGGPVLNLRTGYVIAIAKGTQPRDIEVEPQPSTILLRDFQDPYGLATPIDLILHNLEQLPGGGPQVHQPISIASTKILLQFWEPFVSQETTIVFGSQFSEPCNSRIETLSWDDPAGITGSQDAQATAMILNTLQTLADTKQLSPCLKSLPSAGIHGAPLQDHLILIGGPYSNAITAEILKRIPVHLVFCAAGDIRAIYDGLDKKLYESELKTSEGVSEGIDFGIIARAKNPFNPDKQILVLAGRYGFGSHAAAKAVCTPSLLQVISNQYGISFEALVRVQVVRGWPQAVEVIMCRSMPSSSTQFEFNQRAAEEALRKIRQAMAYPKQPDVTEIIWLGRAGEGAKTMAEVLARAALREGLFAQAFPEYGFERSGAPIKVYNRIARKEIRLHRGTYEPDVLVVLDPTLLNLPVAGAFAGLRADGVLVVNSSAQPQEIRRQTSHPGKIISVDAVSICRETSTRFAAFPVLGATLHAVNLVSLDQVKNELEAALGLGLSQHGCKANLTALELGYERAVIS